MRGAVWWPGHGGALRASAPTLPFCPRALPLPFSSSLPPPAFSSIVLIPGACRLCSGKLQGCWHRVWPGLPGSGRAGVRRAGGLWDAAEADTRRVLRRWPQGWVPGGEQHGDSSAWGDDAHRSTGGHLDTAGAGGCPGTGPVLCAASCSPSRATSAARMCFWGRGVLAQCWRGHLELLLSVGVAQEGGSEAAAPLPAGIGVGAANVTPTPFPGRLPCRLSRVVWGAWWAMAAQGVGDAGRTPFLAPRLSPLLHPAGVPEARAAGEGVHAPRVPPQDPAQGAGEEDAVQRPKHERLVTLLPPWRLLAPAPFPVQALGCARHPVSCLGTPGRVPSVQGRCWKLLPAC